MKKLLSLFSSFGIAMTSYSSLISCFKSIKDSTNQSNTKGKTSLKESDKNPDDQSIKPSKPIEQINSSSEQQIINQPLSSTSTLKLTDQQKVNHAVSLIRTINNEEIGLISPDLTIIKLQDAIKAVEKYQQAIALGVTLKKDKLNFKKLPDVILNSDAIIEINDSIIVKGTFISGSKTKDFSFTIKIVDFYQQQVSNAIKKLNEINQQEISLANADLNVIQLKKAIEGLDKYKAVFNDSVKLKAGLTLEKTDKTVLNHDSHITNNDLITVKGTVISDNKEQDFSFTIKIIDPDQQKVNHAVKLLQKINNEQVNLTETDLTNPLTIIEKIKMLEKYQAATKDIILCNDLTLKNSSGTIITTVTYKTIVTVQGEVKSGSKTKAFNFTIKIVDPDQQQLEHTIKLLQEITNEQIGLTEANLANWITPLKTTIKNLDKYQKAIANVNLKEDELIFENENGTGLTSETIIQVNDSITVKGTVISGNKKQDFSFTITIVDFDQQQLDHAVKLLQDLDKEDVKLASADLKVEKIETAIKNKSEYQDAITNVTLKEDKMIFENANGTVLTSDITIMNEDSITVKGSVISGSKEQNFSFTIKVINKDLMNVEISAFRLKNIKNVVIPLAPINLNIDKLKAAIKDLKQYKTNINSEVKLKEDLILEKTGVILNEQSVIKNNDIIVVKGTIIAAAVEKEFRFTIKIKESLTAEEKVDATVAKLNSIKSNTKVELTEAELTIVKLKSAILKLKEYHNAFRSEVLLVPDSISLESSTGEVLSSDSTNIIDEQMIIVTGTVKSEDIEKDFTFTIQVTEINTEKKAINNAITSLESMTEKVITLEKSQAKITNIIANIKNMNEYKDVIKDPVSLKNNNFTLKKTDATSLTDTTIENNDIITVKGIVKTINIEQEFTFTIKLQVTDYWF